jgi:aspartate aminotransferase-like enzyme
VRPQTGFLLTVSALPAGCAVYYLSRPGEDGEAPALTQWINSFRKWDETWEERNTLHTAAVQQAAADRALLYSAPRAANHELRFPE